MHFTPRPSRLLTQILLLSHLGSLGIVLLLTCVWLIKLGGCLAVFLSLIQHRHYLRTTPTLTFTLESAPEITLTRHGESETATLDPLTVVTPFLVLLRLKLNTPTRHTITLPLFYDTLPEADFRQLRMRLRFRE